MNNNVYDGEFLNEAVNMIEKSDVDKILIDILKKFRENFNYIERYTEVDDNPLFEKTITNCLSIPIHGDERVVVKRKFNCIYCGDYMTSDKDVLNMFNKLYSDFTNHEYALKEKNSARARQEKLIRDHANLSFILNNLNDLSNLNEN